MSDRLKKDDLSEYLVKLQKLQRMCLGCRKFRITTEETSISVSYAHGCDVTVFFIFMVGDFESYATMNYEELKKQLIKDNWL